MMLSYVNQGLALLFSLFLQTTLAEARRGPQELAPSEPAPSYKITLDIDFSQSLYFGKETVRYVNASNEPLDEIYFLLYPNIKILSKKGAEPVLYVQNVQVRGEPAAIEIEQGAAVRVALPRSLKPNEEVEITLEFIGKVPILDSQATTLAAHFTGQISDVLGGQRRTTYPRDPFFVADGVMVLADFHPVLAIRRPIGWRTNVRPSVDDYTCAEAADYEVELHVPLGLAVFTSGVPVFTVKKPNEQILTFTGKRLRDFMIITGSNFKTLTQSAGSVQIESVCRPEDEAIGRRILQYATGALTIYEARFGPYPYPQLRIVEAPLPVGLMTVEATCLVAIARAYYVDFHSPSAQALPALVRESSLLIEDALELGVAYGVARQWWGLAVGFDPERAHYLDNALATYGAILYNEETYGREAAQEQIDTQLKAAYRVYRMFGGADQAANQPASHFRNGFQYAALVHAKGALFLNAVRQSVGDEAFFAALQRFYDHHRFAIVDSSRFLNELNNMNADRRAEITELYKRWMTERHGDQDIARPEYRIVVSARMQPSEEDRPSAFEWLGRFIARQMTRVGKYATKPF